MKIKFEKRRELARGRSGQVTIFYSYMEIFLGILLVISATAVISLINQYILHSPPDLNSYLWTPAPNTIVLQSKPVPPRVNLKK